MPRLLVRLPQVLPTAGASGQRPPRGGGWRSPSTWLIVGAVLAAIAGGLLGYFARFDLPDVRALTDYNPPQMTRVVAVDSVEVDDFAEQRRLLIDHGEIPEVFRQALLAIEDTSFESHPGIDFRGLARAVWRDVTTLSLAQGASTLTQQLARNLFLHPDKTLRRKLQEAFLALEIERHYSKQEILGFYCNQIYMGHGRYGLEAASRFYFDKPALDLTLGEAAMLAGLIQRPESLTPLRHPERARARRDRVLARMVEVGFIDEAAAEAARQSPLAAPRRRSDRDLAPYFVEDVRRWLQERFGTADLYNAGFEVQTTLDRGLQAIANRAVDHGLRELDRRQGWRGPAGRVPAGEVIETWKSPEWETAPQVDDVRDGLVLDVAQATARVRVGALEGVLDAEAIRWTGKREPRALLHRGDIVRVRLLELLPDQRVRLSLEQEPLAQAALVAIDPATGAVRALVGGFSFARSEFDRVTQARRQTGSAFKPFVYAAALTAGRTLSDTIMDAPTLFLDPQLPKPYVPENYGKKYRGLITLRHALEESTNVGTVRLLESIGYATTIDAARRLGITAPLQPYPSLALGAFESTLLELTAAYGALANQGVLVEPHMVTEVRDRDGKTLERIEPQVKDAVSAEIAFLMNRLLAGVVSDGTGRAAASLNLPLAGKTGTTDDNTDAWFIGYSPRLAVGVWVGFDEPRSLGSRETGAQAALPIWIRFMRESGGGVVGSEEFPVAPGVQFVSIDRRTGLKANQAAGCASVISEAYLNGTEPTGYCTEAHHLRLQLPTALQVYPLDERGALCIPEQDLEILRSQLPGWTLIDGGRRLTGVGAEGPVTLPSRILREGDRDAPAVAPVEWRTDDQGRLLPVVWTGRGGAD